MPVLHNFTFEDEKSEPVLNEREIISLVYHNIFDYPLNFSELLKWEGRKKSKIDNLQFTINQKDGFYFLEGREAIVLKRILRKRISGRKLIIARKYGKILGFIPTIKLLAVTGALAMENADEDSDIDFLLITQKGTLWLTRLIILFLSTLSGLPVRRFNDKNPKDKLCLNMWLDEANLTWRKRERNVFTAHEIAQIQPIINRDKTYERLIFKNKWIKDYWPNAVKTIEETKSPKMKSLFFFLFEKIAFGIQYLYMRRKITREIVTPTRALFHPNDWGEIVLKRLVSSQ